MTIDEVKEFAKVFPSPYGVSFILIDKTIGERLIKRMYKVSVSLRSIIHSYFQAERNVEY